MNNSDFGKLSALTIGAYEAFLYDCDGTLADNMPSHTETYVDVAKEYGVIIDPKIIYELAGWPIADVVIEINKRYHSSMNPEVFKARKAQLYVEYYMNKIKPIEYVVAHLKAHAGKVRIAVVSGGDRAIIEKTLSIIGVAELVEVLVCAGETPNGKPYPDPFLKAAELLNVNPQNCLVFEDGLPGVAAAEAAQMHWVRVDEFTFG